MDSSFRRLAVASALLAFAAGALSPAFAAKPAPKSNPLKSVVLKLKTTPAVAPKAKTPPIKVDDSEREIWRHQGVG